MPHLFPSLERTLRETEFGVVAGRRAATRRSAPRCPSGPSTHDFHAAADGQLGGIMKVYREWRISGDTEWLRALWPKVKRRASTTASRPGTRGHNGVVEEPHHNTYDIEFWGAGRHVHELLPRRAAGRGADGQGARRRACRSTRSWPRKAARGLEQELFERRVLHPEDRVEEPAREEPAGDEEHGRQLLAGGASRSSRRKGRSTSTARAASPTACSARGWPLVCGVGQVLDRAEGRRATCAPCTATTSSSDLSDARQPAAADLRLRRGGRPAALHLAARAASSRCRSSTRTRSGPASSTRWPRT